MKRIPYGISDYETLIKDNCYYVDKTMYLKELEDFQNKIVFLRPRRFGKSLFLSMMSYYYDINAKDKFDELFKDTYVYDNPTCNKNNYYILKFNFSGICGNSIEEIERSFTNKIYNGIVDFCYKYKFNFNIDKNREPNMMLLSLLGQFECLLLENKIYLMIDEYDEFINGLYSSNIELYKYILKEGGILGSFYKVINTFADIIIDRIFITGVSLISLDLIEDAFGISCNISDNLKLNSMLGLTHDEVKELVKELPNKNEIYDLLANNYDGYLFNEEAKDRVFNSTLVMYFLDYYFMFNSIPSLFDPNIISSYEKVKSVVMLNNNNCYLNIIDSLFYNRNVTGNLKKSFNVNVITDSDDIVSLLYYFGYITIDKKIDNESFLFKIPNKMMGLIYNDYYMSLVINKPINSNELEDAIAEIKNKGNISLLCNIVSDIIKNADNRIYNNFNERSIQLMFYSLLVKRDSFDTKFEYPVKDKFIDLMIFKNKDKSNYDIMIEFKYIKKKEYKRSLLERLKNTGMEQLKEYESLLDISKLNLKKYLVIYVGSEIKVMEEIL